MSKKIGKRNYYDYFFYTGMIFFFLNQTFSLPNVWEPLHYMDKDIAYMNIYTPYNIAIDDCPEIRDLHSRSRSSKRLTGDIQGTPYSEG